MGLDVPRESFEQADFERFAAKLQSNLQALDLLLRRPGFGEGPASVGAELELNLVDERGSPALVNTEVRALVPDARRTLEIFERWHGRLSGWRLALVCQDGQEDLPMPWDEIAAVFQA